VGLGLFVVRVTEPVVTPHGVLTTTGTLGLVSPSDMVLAKLSERAGLARQKNLTTGGTAEGIRH